MVGRSEEYNASVPVKVVTIKFSSSPRAQSHAQCQSRRMSSSPFTICGRTYLHEKLASIGVSEADDVSIQVKC